PESIAAMTRRAINETMKGSGDGPVLAFTSASVRPRAAIHWRLSVVYQTAPKAKLAMAAIRIGQTLRLPKLMAFLLHLLGRKIRVCVNGGTWQICSPLDRLTQPSPVLRSGVDGSFRGCDVILRERKVGQTCHIFQFFFTCMGDAHFKIHQSFIP